VANLINPFTGELAKKGEYQFVVSLAEKQKYYNRPEKNEVYFQTPQERDYFILNQELNIKQIMKAMIHSNYNLLFENLDEIKRFTSYLSKYRKKITPDYTNYQKHYDNSFREYENNFINFK
jgi:hypothetical protein